jgi:hypothetical protein
MGGTLVPPFRRGGERMGHPTRDANEQQIPRGLKSARDGKSIGARDAALNDPSKRNSGARRGSPSRRIPIKMFAARYSLASDICCMT